MEAKIKFEQYFVDRIILDMPALVASGCFKEADEITADMAMQFHVNIEITDDVKSGKVSLEVDIRPNTLPLTCDDNIPSFITVRIVGLFAQEDEGELNYDQFKKMCEINGVASLFPFLRSAVADIARISNTSTSIILPLINVPKMMKEMKQNESNEKND